MAKQVNYFKVVSLPASLQPSSFYFAKGASDGKFRMWLTTDQATPQAIELDAVPNARQVIAGTGLTGGGDLSSDKTLSLDVAYTDSRFGRLDFDNTWTKHNHFDNAISIPNVAPVGPHGNRTYLHFGALGTGSETPPLVANLTDLQDVNISAGDQSADGVVSWSASLGKFVLGNSVAGYIPLSQKGQANGVATLGADGKLVSSQLPSLVIVDTFTVASQAAMLALSTAEQGDVAIRTDENKSYILTGGSPSVLANWEWLRTPSVANSDQVPEGTSNLYFTQARARAALSAGTGISYNATSGAISLNRGTTDTWYEPVFSKNTAFNKNFGTAAGTVAQGNDARINNGQTAFDRGDFRDFGLGRTSAILAANANVLTATSFIGTAAEFIGSPFPGISGANQGYLNHYSWGTGYKLQEHTPLNSNVARRYRLFNDSGWSDWVTMFDSNNLGTTEHTWTAHNHFDAAISIPNIAPVGHAGKTYLHFGDLGTGAEAPPLVANLSDLQDVTITGATNGQVLQWDGSKWINSTVPLDLSGYVQKSAQIIAGTGLTGGGNLSADRTLSVNFGTVANTVAMGNHLHDDRYLRLTGGVLSGTLVLRSDLGGSAGRIGFYSPDYYTWYDYMSPDLTPTGANFIPYGGVDSYSRRSLIESIEGYGWVWESSANTQNAVPVPMMALTSQNGNLTIRGTVEAGADATLGSHLPRLSQVTTLITNATSWSQEAW